MFYPFPQEGYYNSCAFQIDDLNYNPNPTPAGPVPFPIQESSGTFNIGAFTEHESKPYYQYLFNTHAGQKIVLWAFEDVLIMFIYLNSPYDQNDPPAPPKASDDIDFRYGFCFTKPEQTTLPDNAITIINTYLPST